MDGLDSLYVEGGQTAIKMPFIFQPSTSLVQVTSLTGAGGSDMSMVRTVQFYPSSNFPRLREDDVQTLYLL